MGYAFEAQTWTAANCPVERPVRPRRLIRVTPVETIKMKVFISLAEAFDW